MIVNSNLYRKAVRKTENIVQSADHCWDTGKVLNWFVENITHLSKTLRLAKGWQKWY